MEVKMLLDKVDDDDDDDECCYSYYAANCFNWEIVIIYHKL